MNLIYQSLIKSLDDFIYFEIVYNSELLLNARLNETFQKDLVNVLIFIIETNAINSIVARFQINFETQKYDKDFTFITNIINLKVVDEIVFESHKIFIIIKISES